MRIDAQGQLLDEPCIRVGFIGCGSHAFRNIYPAFQFAPVKLAAVCDLSQDKAEAFAAQFGAQSAYNNHHEMLARERLDAVFIVTGYRKDGRPLYPRLSVDCLEAGCHVWIEKPPAASCAEIDRMHEAARKAQRIIGVGFKKMFFPANQKVRQLMQREDFGSCSQVLLHYPQYLPTTEEFEAWGRGEANAVTGFLDHICHPVSLMAFLLGKPETLFYVRSASGGGNALFTFASGAVASIALTHGASMNGGMEHTVAVGANGMHITVVNNSCVTLHRNPPLPYGVSPTFYEGGDDGAALVWTPEFSLGQLYNKGLFLLGYVGEITEFARAVLEKRELRTGTIEQAHWVTRVFEGFSEGPNKVISLAD